MLRLSGILAGKNRKELAMKVYFEGLASARSFIKKYVNVKPFALTESFYNHLLFSGKEKFSLFEVYKHKV